MGNNGIVNLADVDTSNGVIITLNNPHNPESIQMDYGFEWPKDKVYIIQAIKGAARMGLSIQMQSENPEAERFITEYYNEYTS